MMKLYRIFPLIFLTLDSLCAAGFHGRKILEGVSKSDDGAQQQNFDAPFKTTKPSIDPNIVLILAALLCALFFGLGLNLVIRCTLCLCSLLRFNVIVGRGHVRGADHASMGLGAAGANTGLKKDVIEALPVAVYGADGGPVTECVICLREFADGEKIRVLPKCSHCFHVECIDRWLVSHSLCPICRGHMADEKPRVTVPLGICGRNAGNESTAPGASQSAATDTLPSVSTPSRGSGTDIESGVNAENRGVL